MVASWCFVLFAFWVAALIVCAISFELPTFYIFLVCFKMLVSH